MTGNKIKTSLGKIQKRLLKDARETEMASRKNNHDNRHTDKRIVWIL